MPSGNHKARPVILTFVLFNGALWGLSKGGRGCRTSVWPLAPHLLHKDCCLIPPSNRTRSDVCLGQLFVLFQPMCTHVQVIAAKNSSW